jgi:hypothetical protein
MGKGREYSSTQVNLPEDLSRQIITWGVENIRDQDLHPESLHSGREQEPHITILQGITNADPQKVRFLVKNESPLLIRLGRVRIFYNEGFDVVIVDVDCPALYGINQLLVERFNSYTTYPKYIPHVTVAYVLKNSVQPGDESFLGQSFLSRQIVFSDPRSHKSTIKLRGRLDSV